MSEYAQWLITGYGWGCLLIGLAVGFWLGRKYPKVTPTRAADHNDGSQTIVTYTISALTGEK